MFKDKLRELRLKEGISQYELADKLFVSRSAIAKWENGNGIPSDANLEALCKFFDVSEEWILDRDDMKEVVKNLDKRNNKLLWFILGLVIPLILILLTMIPIFTWACPKNGEICPAVVVYPQPIFVMLYTLNILIAFFPILVYLYQLIFSFIYWKKDFPKSKLIQIINIAISTICFVITFIIAYNVALNKGYMLF
mgnify:CR=1 FL=1